MQQFPSRSWLTKPFWVLPPGDSKPDYQQGSVQMNSKFQMTVKVYRVYRAEWSKCNGCFLGGLVSEGGLGGGHEGVQRRQNYGRIHGGVKYHQGESPAQVAIHCLITGPSTKFHSGVEICHIKMKILSYLAA